MASDLPKVARDNRANQLNPTHTAYHASRGTSSADAQNLAAHSKPVRDNRANQLNPNHHLHGDRTAVSSTSNVSVKPSPKSR